MVSVTRHVGTNPHAGVPWSALTFRDMFGAGSIYTYVLFFRQRQPEPVGKGPRLIATACAVASTVQYSPSRFASVMA